MNPISLNTSELLTASSPPEQKHKVLYFYSNALGYEFTTGGTLCCLNNIARLAEDPQIDLTFVQVGQSAMKDASLAKVAHLPIKSYFVSHVSPNYSSCAKRQMPKWLRILSEKWEIDHSDVSREIVRLVEELAIETVVVEHIDGIHLLQDLLKSNIRIVYISENRESEFFWQGLLLEWKNRLSLSAFLRYFRLTRFEQKAFQSVDQIIWLSNRDLPKEARLRTKASIITPYLNPRQDRWSYSNSKRILFVGWMVHYPNYLAAKWLCDLLAPNLLRTCPEAKITIVSRPEHSYDFSKIPSNVEILSDVSREDLESLFKTCDLFIAPIKNDFGVKFKILECLTFGTPFLATEGCLCGLPYLDKMTPFSLKAPQEVARRISDLIANPSQLNTMSEYMHRQYANFTSQQEAIWSRTLNSSS